MSEKLFSQDRLIQICDVKPKKIEWNSENYLEIKHKDIVFVITDHIPLFVSQIWPIIEEKKIDIILITGISYTACPKEICEKEKINYQLLVDSPRLIHWFTPLLDYQHIKLTCLPIGINYIEIIENTSFFFREEEKIDRILFVSRFTNGKKIINQHYIDEIKIIDTPSDLADPENELLQISNYKYIFGSFKYQDHPNIWEAIALGTIPIIFSGELNHIYDGFPVVFINDLLELCGKLKITEKTNNERIFISYWTKLIKSYK